MTDPAFAEVLAGLLSADGVQRKASEEKLEHYKTTERKLDLFTIIIFLILLLYCFLQATESV